MDKLQKFNRIEEISLPAYLHREDQPQAFSDPGLLPYTRGSKASSNDWHIGSCFRVENEQACNKQLLEALMAGTTALVIHATSDRDLDFATLFSEVDLQYIHTTFYPKSTAQATAFLSFLGNYSGAVVAENTSEWLNCSTTMCFVKRKTVCSAGQSGSTIGWNHLAGTFHRIG